MDIKSKTRKATTIFGLGNAITADDEHLTGVCLPTNKQVLRSLMCLMQKEECKGKQILIHKWKCAAAVLTQVKEFYAKANVPVMSDCRCIKIMLGLLEDNAKLRQIPQSRRENPNTLEKLQIMSDHLEKTFSCWPQDAMSVIKNEEDKTFLKSMMTDRLASFGSLDKKNADKEARREKRVEEKKSKQEQWKHESSSLFKSQTSYLSDSESEQCEDTEDFKDESVSRKRSHHRHRYTGTEAFIPHDILKRPSLVSVATRLNMSPMQQKAYTEALIHESGGDSEKIALSYSTTDKARRSVASQIAYDIKDTFTPPDLATLHWDGKQVSTLSDKNEYEERLPILLGSASGVKLLGVAKYPPGSDQKTGDLIGNSASNFLFDWGCTKSVINMCFDTTASNTGHISAACITLQKNMDRALLWSACRHHIGELILNGVFETLKIEVAKSPEVTIFQRFQKNWPNIAHDDSCSLSVIEVSNILLEKQKKKCLKTLTISKKLCRSDYNEMVSLCEIILQKKDRCTKLLKPGAMHKARWMSKILYAIKMVLLQEQIAELPKGTVATKHQLEKLTEFVIFVCFVYIDWWLKCQSVKTAPFLDLNLYKTILEYTSVNKDISSSALRVLNRHLWYLTPEMVVLAIFDDQVPANDLRIMADKLLSVKPEQLPSAPAERFGSGFGKPLFPSVEHETTLADLLSPDSWYTVKLLNLDMTFLNESIDIWHTLDAYKDGIEKLKSINVVNDPAERAVKMTTDFLPKAKSEMHFQNVLQVVEQDRKNQPNLRKKMKMN